jgi:hypothetical protein
MTELLALYAATKRAIMQAPLTAEQINEFNRQLATLPRTNALEQAIVTLITDNLSFPRFQIFYVQNINSDGSLFSFPLHPFHWQALTPELRQGFVTEAFMYQARPVDLNTVAALI